MGDLKCVIAFVNVLLVGHFLLGDQKNGCNCHEDSADYVEDCGSDAAGGRKRAALVVGNCDICESMKLFL